MFLSFRLELTLETTKQPTEMKNPTPPTTPSASSTTHLRPQLNLLPLQQENLVEAKETTTVAYFFDPAAEGGTTATLTALLGAGSPSEGESTVLLPPTCATYGEDLVRTAMRSKERSATSEEKWVCYEEVTSCASELLFRMRLRGRLSLKLDYQEIMNAWTDDKGPLYVQPESPQTVPDLLCNDEFFDQDQFYSNGLKDGWGSNDETGGLWTVPELNILQGEEWKQAVGVRQASVMRYKEKRQNRLFSKRIRYEVRKINAEKRPRMKGRFVKRS